MNLMTDLAIITDGKEDSYDAILVIIDYLIKIIYYEPIKTTIDAVSLAEIIIDMVVRHYSLQKSILSDKSSLFIFKFWFLLCYLLCVMQKGLPHFICGQIARLRNRMTQWRFIYMNLLIRNKTIRLGSC